VGVPDTASQRPVAAFHGVSRRSEDSCPEDQDGYWFRPTRAAFRRPSGGHPPDLASTRRSRVGPPCAFVPLRRRVPAAPQRSGLSRPEGRRAPRPAMLPLLSFRALRHSLGPADPLFSWAADPSATACHVRGLATSFAALTTSPPGARSAGASMSFALQGLPLVRERFPSRGPCPPDVAGRPHSRGSWDGSGRLQGLVPATSPCCHRTFPRERRPSMPSWASPLQSLLPIRPGDRLWSRCRPSCPWAG
jgi:hypothetical protein